MNERSILERSLRMPGRPDGLTAYVQKLSSVAGFDSYCQGDLEAAAKVIQAQLQRDREDGAAWELLGLTLRDQGQPLAAADAFEKASLLHCIQPLSRICLAECYTVLKRYDLARELYMLQADELAEDVEMLLIIASGLDGIDKPCLAIQLCRIAAALEPQSGQISYDMCFYSMRCGCTASVAKMLAWRAVELEPENVHFRIGLTSLLLRLGERDRAAWVLGRVKGEQIQQLSCRCCLERIAELFEEMGDVQGLQACVKRLHALELPDRDPFI